MTSSVFSMENVFDTAIQIERNGESFYTKAAQHAWKSPLRETLLELAHAESVHAASFAWIKARLLDHSGKAKHADADGIVARYLQGFSERMAFDMTGDAPLTASDTRGMKELLKLAIERERDSILFYTGIHTALPEGADRDAIDAMITEEMAHLVALTMELKEL